MSRLVQNEKNSIIYGTFRGKENQELFRCPRELDNIDLRKYINENRECFHFEVDNTENVRKVKGMKMVNYWRMGFDGQWWGRWMDSTKMTKIECLGVNNIIRLIMQIFPEGCNSEMKEYCKKNYIGNSENTRFFVRPYMSNMYKIMFDTKWGNADYPVRIYVYRKEC